MSLQILTLELDDVTAGDYLQWAGTPGPPGRPSRRTSCCGRHPGERSPLRYGDIPRRDLLSGTERE